MLAALSQHHLLANTAIILSAKHGQAPIDPNEYQTISKATLLAGVDTSVIAQITTDDIALIWLTDASKTSAVVSALSTQAHEQSAQIQEVLSGDTLKLMFNDPTKDARSPDIVVVPEQGVIYTGSTQKIAEHGGFNEDATHVSLLIASPELIAGHVYTPVQTTQLAPTILRLLGLDPAQLVAVQIEQTQLLPGFEHA
jgi:arylsulfatase A-like enzyme